MAVISAYKLALLASGAFLVYGVPHEPLREEANKLQAEDDFSLNSHQLHRFKANQTQLDHAQFQRFPYHPEFCKPGGRVFDAFVERTATLVNTWTVKAADPTTTGNAAVIAEARDHPHFEWVVKNVMHMLGPTWALYVFHGAKNKDYLHNAIGGDDSGAVFNQIVFPTGSRPDALTQNTYGYYMMQRQFWDTFAPNIEHILVFQSDSAALRPLREGEMEKYLTYDYVGSPWDFAVPLNQLRIPSPSIIAKSLRDYFDVTQAAKPALLETSSNHTRLGLRDSDKSQHNDNSQEQDPNPFSGNGGFSIRNVRKSKSVLECCKQIDDGYHLEDQIFIKCFQSIGAKVANWREALDFSMESLYMEPPLKPFGFHKPWCYLPPPHVATLLSSSALAANVEEFEHTQAEAAAQQAAAQQAQQQQHSEEESSTKDDADEKKKVVSTGKRKDLNADEEKGLSTSTTSTRKEKSSMHSHTEKNKKEEKEKKEEKDKKDEKNKKSVIEEKKSSSAAESKTSGTRAGKGKHPPEKDEAKTGSQEAKLEDSRRVKDISEKIAKEGASNHHGGHSASKNKDIKTKNVKSDSKTQDANTDSKAQEETDSANFDSNSQWLTDMIHRVVGKKDEFLGKKDEFLGKNDKAQAPKNDKAQTPKNDKTQLSEADKDARKAKGDKILAEAMDLLSEFKKFEGSEKSKSKAN